jgi:hypothetical protein
MAASGSGNPYPKKHPGTAEDFRTMMNKSNRGYCVAREAHLMGWKNEAKKRASEGYNNLILDIYPSDGLKVGFWSWRVMPGYILERLIEDIKASGCLWRVSGVMPTLASLVISW